MPETTAWIILQWSQSWSWNQLILSAAPPACLLHTADVRQFKLRCLEGVTSSTMAMRAPEPDSAMEPEAHGRGESK